MASLLPGYVSYVRFVPLSLHENRRAPVHVAQWVKRWPTDLAVMSSLPARGEIFSNRKRGSIAHSLSLSTCHPPDMTEILLKRL